MRNKRTRTSRTMRLALRLLLFAACALFLLLSWARSISTVAVVTPTPPAPAADVKDHHDECHARAAAGERFLLYSPQFGLSNQLVALRNAVVWALLLNRTLVLPHLLGHGTASSMAAHGAAFAVRPSALAPLRVVEMDAFLRRGLAPRRLRVLDIAAKFATQGDGYFDALGVRWHNATAPLRVPMRDFSPASIRAAFGGCAGARVLAFRSLFAALDVKDWREYPPPGLGWLNKVAMPALLRASPALAGAAAEVVGCLRGGAERVPFSSCPAIDGYGPPPDLPGAARGLACAHIRAGDFVDECAKYQREMASGKPRPWVASHFSKGWSCLQEPHTLAANLRALVGAAGGAARPLALYASIEDPSPLRGEALRPFNLSSLGDFEPWVGRLAPRLPAPIASVLLDQLVCARASHLVLNAFSTFSQLVMGRIGLEHAQTVGWARDLNEAQQRAVGVTVLFHRRTRRDGVTLSNGRDK